MNENWQWMTLCGVKGGDSNCMASDRLWYPRVVRCRDPRPPRESSLHTCTGDRSLRFTHELWQRARFSLAEILALVVDIVCVLARACVFVCVLARACVFVCVLARACVFACVRAIA